MKVEEKSTDVGTAMLTEPMLIKTVSEASVEERRRAEEIEIYRNCIDVHNLPEIYHFWSNRWILPKLQACGFESVDDFYLHYMLGACRERPDKVQQMVSIGAGNCDLEISLASSMRRAGVENFHIDCLELNPHMIERGRELAAEQGLEEKFSFTVTDIDLWQPAEQLSICIANHSLHHIVELELLFGKLVEAMGEDGVLLTNDMIGRNGHMRWPEALELVEELWADLPDRYKYNHAFRRTEREFVNWDCSVEGNEGIRAQDILPLLIEHFHFDSCIAFANVIDIFVDRTFGHNFDPKDPHDVDFIERVATLDEAKIDSGEIKPTHLIAALRAVPVDQPRSYRHWTPEFCLRDPAEDQSRAASTDTTDSAAVPEQIPRSSSDVAQLIHSEVLTDRDPLRQSFRSADFYPHVVIDNFFSESLCQKLLEEFPEYSTEHALNESGNVGLKAVREAVRGLGPAYVGLDDFARSKDFLGLMTDLTGIPDLLYDPEYIGGGTHDNLHGTELDVHVDFNYHPCGWHRRLNLIVFLNPEWEESWGGCFEVHSNPWSTEDQCVSIVPIFNRAVIFETNEHSWHGFDKIQLPEDKRHITRKSFALYLYTADRPEDEIAPAHATVYVPRPLAGHIVAGHTLNEDDAYLLAVAMSRRDQHIQFLYEREKEFSDMLARQKSRIEALESLLGNLPIEGHAKLTDRAEGLWEDLWAGATLSFGIRAEQSLEKLRLQGWVPDFFPPERQLRIEVGDQLHQVTLGRGTFTIDLPVTLEPQDEVDIRILCQETFDPKAKGTSDDSRQLAYMVGSLVAS